MDGDEDLEAKPYWWVGLTPMHFVLAAFGVVALVALAWGVVNGNMTSDDGSDGADIESDHFAATSMCEEYAKDRLKAPSTAKFNLSTSGTGPRFTVTGSVDAENSFGAKMRNDITCVIRLDGERAYLESLTGLD